jgi:bifunctional UDP-N-acetylglucosamine pyrophosphorylase/glucosamine-1-phosphate N-acetyltransferase
MTNQIVILAAGKGTRMGGDMPKVLIMLKQKPLIFYLLMEIEKINLINKPIIVVGYMAEKVREFLGHSYKFAVQEKQLGTAHALMAAKPEVGAENILVLYGDMPFIKAESMERIMRFHLEAKNKISMLTAKVPEFTGSFSSLKFYGRIIRDKNQNLAKVVEYKDASEEQKQITEVNPGIYVFNTEWLWKNLKQIQNKNSQGEYYLTDIIEIAIAGKEKIGSLEILPEEVLGVNTREDLEIAEKFCK